MLRDFRKPLVIAAPKIGLKHPRANSHISEFDIGTKFRPIIANQFGTGSIKRVIFCSGKVSLDIEARLEKAQLAHGVKVIRLEELAPFPVHHIQAALENATSDASYLWVQEECMNQGAF